MKWHAKFVIGEGEGGTTVEQNGLQAFAEKRKREADKFMSQVGRQEDSRRIAKLLCWTAEVQVGGSNQVAMRCSDSKRRETWSFRGENE